MSLFHKIRFWSRRSVPKTYIIDTAIFAPNNNRGRLAGNAQTELIRNLERLAKEEGIKIIAVFEAVPGETTGRLKSDNISISYATSADGLYDCCLKFLGSQARRKSNIIVTADRTLERRVHEDHGTTMRGSTFKKMMDNALFEEVRRPGPQQQHRRRPPRRGGRDIGARNNRRRDGGDDQVNKYIDLVDDDQPPQQ